MNYFSCQDKELLQVGIQEGELAVYTGTVNPRQADHLGRDTHRRNAYTYLWQDGQPLELDAQFSRDRVGPDILDVQAGEEKYTFLRDGPSGYIRQTAGPAAPIVVANIGAVPLRVDTFLGRFTVQAGTMLRLDEKAPRREKKKIVITLSSDCEQPLKSAELWDGTRWRRLNIREEPFTAGEVQSFTVLDGSAIVQQAAVNGKGELLMMDSPEPDADYEIYVTVQAWGWVTLCFDRRDYQDGRVVQRVRTISPIRDGEAVAYDLQKLRESRTEAEGYACLAKLPGPPAEGEARPAPRKRMCPRTSEKLKAFLEIEDAPDRPDTSAVPEAPHLEPGEGGLLDEAAEPESWDFHSPLTGPNRDCQETRAAPVPEPPEDFPE